MRCDVGDLANLREAGVKIGVGTDGGTGITFAGQLDSFVELLRYAHGALRVEAELA